MSNRILAERIINTSKYSCIADAMDLVLGVFTEQNKELHIAVFNEIETILTDEAPGDLYTSPAM